MSISSSINLATQHKNEIIDAANRLEGALEASISVTNINVSENIQNVVSASNCSANGIRVLLMADANNIYQIGETFELVDVNMKTGMLRS